MKMNGLSRGQLVRSKAGRDKGTLLVITEIIDQDHVYIADGALRKIEAPKKKKIKHLQMHKDVSDAIKEKLDNGEKIEDAFIRRQLAEHQ